MYIPKHFAINDSAEIDRFITENGFGELISSVNGALFATHLPLLYSPAKRLLRGHIARANPQWQELAGQRVLVILSGAHGYISPSWYSDPGVPTWNYQAVHLTGIATFTDDPSSLHEIVTGLTAQYEARLPAPWTPDYDAAKLRGIMGIEIAIENIECKYKLSQNRSAIEQARATEELRRAGNRALADAMGRVQ
jgi:transcriptional regulator